MSCAWMKGWSGEAGWREGWREGWCWMNSSCPLKVIREPLGVSHEPAELSVLQPRGFSTRPPDAPLTPWRGKTWGPSPSSSAPSPTWWRERRSSRRWSPRRRWASGMRWTRRGKICSPRLTWARRTLTSWRRWSFSWSRTKPACSGSSPAPFTSLSQWSQPSVRAHQRPLWLHRISSCYFLFLLKTGGKHRNNPEKSKTLDPYKSEKKTKWITN